MHSRRSFLVTGLALSSLAFSTRSSARAQSPSSAAPVDPVLADYLSLSPSSVANIFQAVPLLAGNAALQADTLDIALPFDMANDDQKNEWIEGMANVALPSFLAESRRRDDFKLVAGFDISEITSGAEIGAAPDEVTFLRGAFDQSAIEATLRLNGFEDLEIDGHPVLSLFPEGRLDLSNPVSGVAMARMNNATFLDDGTLVLAPSLALIAKVLAPQSTLIDQPFVAEALYTLDTPLITSVLFGPGLFLLGPPSAMPGSGSREESPLTVLTPDEQDVSPDMSPPVLACIAGNSPGGPIELVTHDPASIDTQPTSLSKLALAYATSEDAAIAAQQIEERLETGSSTVTGEPWGSLFASWSAVPNPDHSSVLVTLEWTGRAARTTKLLFNRDIGFITG